MSQVKIFTNQEPKVFYPHFVCSVRPRDEGFFLSSSRGGPTSPMIQSPLLVVAVLYYIIRLSSRAYTNNIHTVWRCWSPGIKKDKPEVQGPQRVETTHVESLTSQLDTRTMDDPWSFTAFILPQSNIKPSNPNLYLLSNHQFGFLQWLSVKKFFDMARYMYK